MPLCCILLCVASCYVLHPAMLHMSQIFACQCAYNQFNLLQHRAIKLLWNLCAASRLSEARRARQKLLVQWPPPQAAAQSALARTQALLCFMHWARSCTTSAQMLLKAVLTLTAWQELVWRNAICQCQVRPCRCPAAATSHVRWLTGWACQLDGSMSVFAMSLLAMSFLAMSVFAMSVVAMSVCAMSGVHHHNPCDSFCRRCDLPPAAVILYDTHSWPDETKHMSSEPSPQLEA